MRFENRASLSLFVFVSLVTASISALGQAQLAYLPGTTSTLTTNLSTSKGIATDGAGHVYIAVSGSNHVVEVTTTTSPYTVSTLAITPAVSDPLGVAIDSNNTLYVSGGVGGAGYLAKVVCSPALPLLGGSCTAVALATSYTGLGVATDSSNNVYFLEQPTSGGAPTVEEFSPLGTLITSYTFPNPGAYGLDYNIAVDLSGNIFVSDPYDIYEQRAGSTQVVFYSSTSTYIKGLAVSAAGSVRFAVASGAIYNLASSQYGYSSASVFVTLPVSGVNGLADDFSGSLYATYGSSTYGAIKLDRTKQTLAFGNVMNGTTSGTQTVTLGNVGTEAYSGSGNSNSPNYSISGNCNLGAIYLPPASSCSLGIAFTPSATGEEDSSITINDNTSASPNTITLTGAGVTTPGIILSSAGKHNFGTVVNGESLSYGIRVTNRSGSAFAFSLTLTGASDFTESTRCPASLPNGTSCEITFTYTAGSSAVFPSGSNTSNVETATYTIAKNGQVFSPGNTGILLGTAAKTADLILNTDYHNFGVVPFEEVSAPFGLIVQNPGNTSVTATFSYTGDANLVLQGSDCNFNTMVIPAHGQCYVTLAFQPDSVGQDVLTVTITPVGAPGVSPSNTLTFVGTGVYPNSFTTSTAGHNFLMVQQGGTSSIYGITLTNSYNDALNLSYSLGDGTDFAVVTNTCGTQLVSRGTCHFSFEFTPKSAGFLQTLFSLTGTDAKTGQVVRLGTPDGGGNYAGITLKGTGEETILLPVTGHNFGNVVVGQTSGTTSVTLTNQGPTLAPVTYTLTGANATDFTVTANGCSGGVPANASCNLTVDFHPLLANTVETATLTFSSTIATFTPQNFYTLTGTGVAANQFTISGTPHHDFGIVPVGSNSEITFGPVNGVYGVQIRNSFSVPVTLNSTYGPTANFTLITNTCGTTNTGVNGSMAIAALSQCNLTFIFTPQGTGSLSTTFTANGGLIPLTYQDGITPFAGLSLTGTGQ